MADVFVQERVIEGTENDDHSSTLRDLRNPGSDLDAPTVGSRTDLGLRRVGKEVARREEIIAKNTWRKSQKPRTPNNSSCYRGPPSK